MSDPIQRDNVAVLTVAMVTQIRMIVEQWDDYEGNVTPQIKALRLLLAELYRLRPELRPK